MVMLRAVGQPHTTTFRSLRPGPTAAIRLTTEKLIVPEPSSRDSERSRMAQTSIRSKAFLLARLRLYRLSTPLDKPANHRLFTT